MWNSLLRIDVIIVVNAVLLFVENAQITRNSFLEKRKKFGNPRIFSSSCWFFRVCSNCAKDPDADTKNPIADVDEEDDGSESSGADFLFEVWEQEWHFHWCVQVRARYDYTPAKEISNSSIILPLHGGDVLGILLLNPSGQSKLKIVKFDRCLTT